MDTNKKTKVKKDYVGLPK